MPKNTPKKPAKPYPDFPLFAHASGQWAKKIRGKLVYFGVWSNPEAALNTYLNQRDDLYAGRVPRPKVEGVTINDLLFRFLQSKQRLQEAGEITARTYAEHKATSKLIIAAFGLERLVSDLLPEDFDKLRLSMAKRWASPVVLANQIQRVRCVFNFGWDAGLLEKPVRFGPGFVKPSKKTMRKHRTSSAKRFIDAAQIRAMLAKAKPAMKAMILLGINCGFGNHDCATLTTRAVDLKAGWVAFPRPKTGVERRAKLWPETVEAIREATKRRPAHKESDDAAVVFITKYGYSWRRDAGGGHGCPVSAEFGKLLRAAGVVGKGIGFYSLRHTFRTVADGSKDQPAIDLVMGHERADMATIYREGIADDRLEDVANHVHRWLFPEEVKDTETGS